MKTIHLHLLLHRFLHLRRHLRLHLRLHHLNFKIYNLIINKTYYNMKRIYNSESYDSYKLETFQ
jgi:hypothetical protein